MSEFMGAFNMFDPLGSSRQFSSSQPVFSAGDDLEAGAAAWRRRQMVPQAPAAPPAPRPQPATAARRPGVGMAGEVQVANMGESRAGLNLSTGDTAGNAAIANFAGQTQATHKFLCTAVLVTLNWANDPAAVNDTRVYARCSAPPLIGGQVRLDGLPLLNPGKSHRIALAEPYVVDTSTPLTPGSWNLIGGTAPMSYSIQLQYLTELEDSRILISR